MKGIKKADPQKLHEKDIAKTTDMITAEDLVEQAVYATNTPSCCDGDDQAENMLDMLGANIMDDDIYHDESEHPELKM